MLKQRLAGASLLIYANKQDLPSALTKDEIASRLGLEEIVSHHWQIEACSAYSGENLVTGLDWIVNDISSRIFLLE